MKKSSVISVKTINVIFVISIFAQNYRTELNIFYNERDVSSIDSYQGKTCQLDLYYPTDSGEYATIVWLHGGGLRAGEKSVPVQMKYKGTAVAAVNYRLYPRVKSPPYIEDIAAAVALVYINIIEFSGDSSLVFVSSNQRKISLLACLIWIIDGWQNSMQIPIALRD